MVTGWFAPGRFRLIGGILASGASVFAPQADGWYSVRGRRDSSEPLHARRDESAGRVAKRVCGSVFYCPGAVQTQWSPKVGTSVIW